MLGLDDDTGFLSATARRERSRGDARVNVMAAAAAAAARCRVVFDGRRLLSLGCFLYGVWR